MEFVKYVGLAHRRGITAQDWKLAGFPEGEEVWWTFENAFTVPVDKFSEDQMRKVIEPDEGFVIVGGEEDEVGPRRLEHDMTPQQAESRIRMVDTAPDDDEVPTDDVDPADQPSGDMVDTPTTTTGGSTRTTATSDEV